MRHLGRLFWLPVAMALVHCGSQHDVLPLAQSPAERNAVPAGRMFHVRLLERLSTRTSHVGESFQAATVASVQAADGARVAPAGALVRAHVVAVNPVTSTMRIKFDTIETERGYEALHATFAPTQQDPALAVTSFTGPGTGYDAAIGPLPPGRSLETGSAEVSPSSTAGATSRAPSATAEPAEITLEVDSTIRLLLTAPLGILR